jgi:hypothetical protein
MTKLPEYLKQVSERYWLDDLAEDVPILIKIIEEMREKLEEISKEKDFVESQSTGMKQYFDTDGARIAARALSTCETLAAKAMGDK